ncbi:MAG: FtsB family cell division protein [Myxococcota bacterium]
MKKVALTLLVLAVISGAAYYVFTHPGLDRAERLEGEVAKLREENRELADKNERLEDRVVALKDDPRLAERKVRESIGFVRPDELIFQFEEPDEEIEVNVVLDVREDELELAGQKIRMADLAKSLDALREDVPTATLTVSFDEQADALRRQRVRDVVEDSALAPAEYEGEED